MLATLRHLIDVLLRLGVYEFLRRIGWQWALGLVALFVALVVLVMVLLAILVAVLI